MKCKTIALILSLATSSSFAQVDSSNIKPFNRNHSYFEVGAFASSSDKMPFWLRSNQYGIVPNKGPAFATFRGGYFKEFDKSKKYDFGFGADIAINAGVENKFYLPEAYANIKLNKFEFYAGRRREIFGLVDTTLTSGSYIWSGNALPIPKVQISIPEYLPIGFIRV